MRTQDIASEYAKKFNEALDNLAEHFPLKHHKRLKKLPRIEFIEPMVVEVMENGNERNILVEKLLEGDYKKFNNNMGYVDLEVRAHQQASEVLDDLAGRLKNLGLGGGGLNHLGAIQEEDSEEEDSSDNEEEGEDLFDAKESAPERGTYHDIKDAYFPQAFSHFTHEKSKGNFMVVDLQGVFTIKDDGTRCYELTDPVIHKHRKKNRQRFKTWSFGRTDRGEKGMEAFFKTHQCTDVCRLLGLASSIN